MVAMLAMLVRGTLGPHCWSCVWRPVEAMVTLLMPIPCDGRAPALFIVEGSKLGYWWKSEVLLLR